MSWKGAGMKKPMELEVFESTLQACRKKGLEQLEAYIKGKRNAMEKKDGKEFLREWLRFVAASSELAGRPTGGGSRIILEEPRILEKLGKVVSMPARRYTLFWTTIAINMVSPQQMGSRVRVKKGRPEPEASPKRRRPKRR